MVIYWNHCWMFWTCVLACMLLRYHHTNATTAGSQHPPTFTPNDLKSFQDNNGKYYRLMILDPNSSKIYIGAREYVYRLDREDIRFRHQRSERLNPSEAELDTCEQKIDVNSEYQCKNHIRSIVIHTNRVYVCGTNAHEPRIYYLRKEDLNVQSKGAKASGVAECPFDPDTNSTFIYIDSGNPENIAALYSATAIDYSTHDPLIYRPALKVGTQERHSFLRTIQRNAKWLNDAHFVASFDMGEFVYFVLRETSIEYGTIGKIVFSRIVRVCKKDKGGKPPVLVDRWTTFMKVRLLCALPGDIPFDFNEIQDVQKNGDMFYAVFTTPATLVRASAVCSFTQSAIDAAFNGPFKEQASINSFWRQARNVPNPRPGACGQSYNEHSLLYIRERPLMHKHVSAWGREPMFYKMDTTFRRIAVDFVGNYTVFFLATNRGEIHKVVHWVDPSTHAHHTIELAVWKPLETLVLPIWQMKLYDDQLYMSTDDRIAQFGVQQCKGYVTCTQCALDPYCGWDSSLHRCRPYQRGLHQDVTTKDALAFCSEYKCCNAGRHYVNVRLHGDPVFLSCASTCTPSSPVVWYRGPDALRIDGHKYHVTSDNGLMLMNATAIDGATYRCQSGDVLLATHIVKVTRCSEPDCYFQEEFRQWCTAFDTYKEQFNHWLCLKNTCLDKKCVPTPVTDTCTVG